MPIVTNGLVGYWNSKQGVNGSAWENIAPNTMGLYNGSIVGAILQTNGFYFDEVDDQINLATSPSIGTGLPYTIEAWVTIDSSMKTLDRNIYGGSSNHFLGVGGSARFLETNVGTGYFESTTTTTLANSYGTLRHIVMTYTGSRIISYVDKVKVQDVAVPNTGSLPSGAKFGTGSNGFDRWKGHIAVIRIYNFALSAPDINQNYAESTNIGLSTPPATPPSVTIVSINKSKISDELNMNKSNVQFKFDKDVTEYTVRVLGTSPTTGTDAQSAIQSITANTEITVEIAHTEGLSEGSNRINIYGKGTDGQWTPYES